MEAGKPYQIGPGAPNYIERVESGIISVNADTDEHSNPYEMGLGVICDLDQDANFIGKAALKKSKPKGQSGHSAALSWTGHHFLQLMKIHGLFH